MQILSNMGDDVSDMFTLEPDSPIHLIASRIQDIEDVIHRNEAVQPNRTISGKEVFNMDELWDPISSSEDKVDQSSGEELSVMGSDTLRSLESSDQGEVDRQALMSRDVRSVINVHELWGMGTSDRVEVQSGIDLDRLWCVESSDQGKVKSGVDLDEFGGVEKGEAKSGINLDELWGVESSAQGEAKLGIDLDELWGVESSAQGKAKSVINLDELWGMENSDQQEVKLVIDMDELWQTDSSDRGEVKSVIDVDELWEDTERGMVGKDVPKMVFIDMKELWEKTSWKTYYRKGLAEYLADAPNRKRRFMTEVLVTPVHMLPAYRKC